jgi:hypothetical protein
MLLAVLRREVLPPEVLLLKRIIIKIKMVANRRHLHHNSRYKEGEG